MMASEVESLFASKLSPLTESKIKELLGKDDVSEVCNILRLLFVGNKALVIRRIVGKW